MDTVQIYSLLNSVVSQSMGEVPVTVVDTGSFVALGNTILNSNQNTEGFINTLVQRIGLTVLVDRAYTSQFRPLVLDDMRWGAIVQKISVEMPDAVQEDAIPLVDGQSVDQYIVNKPVAHQKLFTQRSPYMMFITIQRQWLKEAFLNESAMGAFISLVFQKVRDKLELNLENLFRAAINNYAALAPDSQVVNLVTMYNAERNLTGDAALSAGPTAMFDKDFMAWVAGTIRQLGRDLETMSTIYNIDGAERHTPTEMQNLMLLSKFRTQLETVALSSAFNDDYLKIVSNYTVPFWQGSGTTVLDYEERSKINVTVRNLTTGASEEVTRTNVIGMLFDRDAMGAFRQMEETVTTPLNARGLYTNTFWHEQQLWFNATDENFILLTLN